MTYTLIDLLSLLIVIAGIVVQTRIGIGFALLSAPLLYLIDENYLPGPILILGFCLSLLIVCVEKHTLSIKSVLPAILARFPGSWAGVILLAYLPQWLLGLVIGLSLLLAAALSVAVRAIAYNKVNLIVAGFFSGLSGTVTSIGGPIMALVYQTQPPVYARSALVSFFLIGTPVSILLLMHSGSIQLAGYLLCLKMLPGVGIGFLMAKFLPLGLLSSVKNTILVLSVLSAIFIIGRSVSVYLQQ